MNFKMIGYVLAMVLKLEGFLMVLPLIVALLYRENQPAVVYLICIVVCLVVGFLGTARRPKNAVFYQKDGFVTVSLCWVLLSLVGAVPFVLTHEIPNYLNAVFETVSGFTTTGASILSNVEALSHASLFWRSFSHWIGGMGVLVFILMLIPMRDGSHMFLMKAESPGPDVSKFVPRLQSTAVILYKLYLFITAAEVIALLISRMPVFDALCLTFGTAGTGGFAVLNSGIATYTAAQQWIITIFMIAFGVNFTFYYYILCRNYRAAVKMEEVRVYLIIVLVSIAVISVNISGIFSTASETIRQAAFQVGSIMTTTGYSTTDFNLWPSLSKMILVMLMFLGPCAGSTGGGIKISRVIIIWKSARRELRNVAHPRTISKVKMDGHSISDEMVRSVQVYLCMYVIIFFVSLLIVSASGFSFETNFTAVTATFNNIGPGLDAVGPTMNYFAYNAVSKVVLIIDMLAGRLEILPILLMLLPSTWKRKD